MLSHIVAASENNVIGLRNELPWSLPNDFRYFKNKTWGLPIIMGRKSFNSLKEPLPGRLNIVITRQNTLNKEGIVAVHTIEAAIEKGKESDAKEIFIIGGGEIFKQTIDIVSRIYLTRVHATLQGDTFYPEMNKDNWSLFDQQSFPADEKNNYAYTFEVWNKKPGLT